MAHSTTPDLEQCVAALRAQGVPSTQLIDALIALTRELWRTDWLRGVETAKETLFLSRQLHYHFGVASGLGWLSLFHLQNGELDVAVLEAYEAKCMAERLDDFVLTANALFVVSRSYEAAGNYAQAEKCLGQMLALARKHEDRAREADYLGMLGKSYLDRADFEPALDYYLQAHPIFVSIEDDNRVMTANDIGYSLTRLGRHEEARVWAEKAMAECDPEWQIWRANFLHTLGAVHLGLRNYAEARTCLNESLALSLAPEGRKFTAIEALLEMSKLELVHNRVTAAFNALDQALKLATEIKAVAMQAEAHHALFRLYMLAHDRVTADEHHAQYLRYRYNVESERMEKRMTIIRVEAEVERRQPLWVQG